MVMNHHNHSLQIIRGHSESTYTIMERGRGFSLKLTTIV